MQLSPDTGSIDAALAELRIALPVAALTNIVAERKRNHQPIKDHRRILELWKARQIVAEASVERS